MVCFRKEIALEFFAQAPCQIGSFLLTSKDDYSQLRDAIACLPSLKVQYATPDPSKMAEAFAEVLGLSKESLMQELVTSREELQKQFDAQFAEPEAKMQHQLVTHGLFRWARHPMYAVFLWATIASLLATLNWLISLIPFGLFLFSAHRIEAEERILVELFGREYLEYRRRVSALGPPWSCLGFDAEMSGATTQYSQLDS